MSLSDSTHQGGEFPPSSSMELFYVAQNRETFSLTACLLSLPGQIKECAAEQLGKGYLMSCLVDHRGNISDYHCKQYVTKMTTIIFSDYRLICGFMDSCRDDINSLRCGSISTGEKVR